MQCTKSWRDDSDIASCAEGLGSILGPFKLGRSVANHSPPLRRFFGAVLLGAKPWRRAPPLVTRFGVIP